MALRVGVMMFTSVRSILAITDKVRCGFDVGVLFSKTLKPDWASSSSIVDMNVVSNKVICVRSPS